MSEQHPIPQQISSYQFRLVGDMTLKQFLQLAGGALIGMLLYASPLHPAIKWPLIIISVLLGIGLAFLPIEDRPLSTWIFIFFRSIYSPTLFTWIKAPSPKQYFLPEEATAPKTPPALVKEEPKTEIKPEVLEKPYIANLEEKEESFLTKVTQHFITPGTSVVISEESSGPPPETVHLVAPKLDGLKIPGTQAPEVERLAQAPFPQGQPTGNISDFEITTVSPVTGQAPLQKSATVKFSDEVAPPLPPSKPNTVTGQVLDPEGKIVEGAILEIKDTEGRPVRALRSNKLGHFMIVTPLLNGNYEITTEKEGLTFDTFSFEAQGKTIPPFAIWAKGKSEVNSMSPEETHTVYGR